MQLRQHVGCRLVALDDRPRRIAFDDAGAAKILGDQETGIEIGVADRGAEKPCARRPLSMATNGLTSSAR